MTTRLDRLFLLLDTGSTPLIRKSAAEQLGEVQKLHPYELHILLSKVHGYLRSSNWDTRIAAGQAVEAIAKNVPQWEPRGGPKSESGVLGSSTTAGRVMFSQFNIEKVLQHGASLLGSEGAQYDLDPSTIVLDDRERLKQERQQLNKRLGLDMAGCLGLPTAGLDITPEDVALHSQSLNPIPSGKMVADMVRQQLTNVTQGMSARERNKAKRKAKHLAKQISKDFHGESVGDGEPGTKKVKESDEALDEKLAMDPTSDNTINPEETDEWPFEWFCELLMNDLFNSAWEVRHGAATGLREIIKIHGRGAGKTSDTPADQLTAVNQIWLGDLALRLLCVLALDKFGDYVSDEVVAPVRETSAQALGVVLRFMDEAGVTGVKGILLQLLGQGHWQVRHGGLLGLKYMLAVRQDLTQSLLPQVMPAIYQGLRDADDDVRAVAAAALVPVCNKLVASLPDQVPLLVACLWEILLDLDDLTASTNSVMTLLATLLSHPSTHQARLNVSLTELTPRLWPFLRHNIASVRKSALETFHTLLIMENTENPAGQWLLPILPMALMHVFQRSVLEDRAEILVEVELVWAELLQRVPLDTLLASSIPSLAVWLVLLMQPAHLHFDPSHLVEAKHRVRETTSERQRQLQQESQDKETREYIGGLDSCSASPAERDMCVTRARMTGAKLLGMLACYVAMDTRVYPAGYERPLDSLAKFVIFHLNTKSAVQRYIVSQVVYQWACHSQQAAFQGQMEVKAKLLECLNENVYFDEIALAFTRMQADCRDFIASLKQQGVQTDALFPPGAIVTLEQATALTTTFYVGSREYLKPKAQQVFDERSKTLQITVSRTSTEHQILQVRVLSSLAMAVVMLDALPDKLNPVIRPLMDCVKKEENAKIQEEASKCLAVLLQRCLPRNPCPNPKVLKNLCMFLCGDSSVTPLISQPMLPRPGAENHHHEEASCDIHKGILTLTNLQKMSERSRRWYKRSSSVRTEADIAQETLQEDTETQRLLGIQRRGAEVALTRICSYFGARLEQDGAMLWEMCHHGLSQSQDSLAELTVEAAQELVHSLQVLEVVGPFLHQTLLDKVLGGLDSLAVTLSSGFTVVRHMVGRCLAMLCQCATLPAMHFLVECVLPMLHPAQSNPDCQRQGAIEAVANVVEVLGVDVVPYMVLLVMPVLACMADHNEPIRLMATHCFASLIRLMPLEAGIPDPPEMKLALVQQKEKEREFLEQLLDGSKLQSYNIQVEIKADLRTYQKDGVNWLAFLNKYKLHGILCDDMGLGKTLQSICILANDHFLQQQQQQSKEGKAADFVPSIVVCPPTLVGHWVYEVGKFVDKQYLNPLMYAGPPAERTRLQKKVKKHNLIVASYDVVRNDIDFFSNIRWNYCILDEGHIIRNGKTKLSKAVKQLVCRHRLILSGTPIQNNVLDLWSLFDFLMPGFLGTERQFQARYGKPILLSRDAKSTTKEQEAGALAMEALHRQVLPFILRRLKEDVLQDLPPKIIQDYYCDLSPLQVELYEDFAKSRAKKDIEDSVAKSDVDSKEKKAGTSHIFQALQYLRKVCNHPALVLNSSHPQFAQISAQLQAQHSHPRDLQHAPKLTALKQLLNDCGIGVAADTVLGRDVPVVNQHRVLLFCQLKSMLDMVETDLLKAQMPTVTYVRLDGSVPPSNRHNIVHRFNNDPSIDILLLTTHVGGLGLNLTGADTVIFVEHDWNPMKDLQAMDRAHRIGQKKVVNVYRLITRGTLEEKIMGLQKFKLTIANTVISQDNTSLQTMGTEQLLELFTLDDRRKGESAGQAASADGTPRRESAKSVLESLEELWDERQYETEYNLDSFMKTLS